FLKDALAFYPLPDPGPHRGKMIWFESDGIVPPYSFLSIVWKFKKNMANSLTAPIRLWRPLSEINYFDIRMLFRIKDKITIWEILLYIYFFKFIAEDTPNIILNFPTR